MPARRRAAPVPAEPEPVPPVGSAEVSLATVSSVLSVRCLEKEEEKEE